MRTAASLIPACAAIAELGAGTGRVLPAVAPTAARSPPFFVWNDYLNPHMLTTTYVKRPKCGHQAWMEALMRKQDRAARQS